MPTLRLALAQLNATVGDLEANRRRVEAAVQQGQAWLADLVLVPELAITGYPPEDLLLKRQFVEDNRRALARIVPRVRGTAVLVGFVDRDASGRLYNAAGLIADGRLAGVYHKQCLPNYGVFDERRYFAPGNRPLLFELGGVQLGITICEDLWEPEPAEALAAAGAQALVNISASPYHAGKLQARERIFSEQARRHGLAVVYCNLVGGQDELVFDGASLVLDRHGRRLAHGRQFHEDLLVVDLTAEQMGQARPARGPVIRLPGVRAVRPPLPPTPRPEYGRLEEIYEALCLGLRDYVRKNRFRMAVLGLSGGIDSALVACLAADALGPEAVVGVVMPSRYSSRATQDDARQVAHALGIQLHDISIEPVFEAYLSTLAPVFGRRAPDMTEQNLQARVRGNLLMALSNKFGWLVLTTGNKSELATGYTTLYGDMAGGLAVIKDVPKTLVYDLARWRNERGPGRPIPASVIDRAPSAELAPNQTDQDTLPPYELLDRILEAYVEEDLELREVAQRVGGEAALKMVERVVGMVDRAEYKRRQGPPGLKITPKAFGRDRRMPITNQYHRP
jgi:NAD+ synthase (glutamine-hydrolysing)